MTQDATERVTLPRRRHAVDTAGSTLVRGYVLAALVAVLLLGGCPTLGSPPGLLRCRSWPSYATPDPRWTWP